jgi:hypothetical protein
MIRLQRCTKAGETIKRVAGETYHLRMHRIDPATIVEIVEISPAVSHVKTSYGLGDYFAVNADTLESEVKRKRRGLPSYDKPWHL